MSKKRNLIFISLLILGVFLITSCLPKPPVTEGILKGQIMVPEGSIQAKDLTGQAMADATVNIIDPVTGDIIATTITDANGYYQVFVLEGGPYLLQAIKDGVKVLQITPQVEVGIEYDLGIADCSATAVALIVQAMLDAEDYPDNLADINLTDIAADPDFNDVMSIVCSTIEAGGDPTALAVVQQAVEDFLYPLTPAPPTTPAPTPVQATPTFNPPAGAVAFGTTVTITSAGADAIYYTTDGSNPATSVTGATLAYTAPLTIDAAKTVKALAVKAGYTNSAIGSAAYTQAAATAPSNIVLAVGSTNPVGGVTNVAIPAAGGTDTTGAVTGWVATTADKIKFTVTDTGAAVSTIGINTGPYTSEADYTITAPSGLMIVVTTTETGKVTGVRTFTVTVAAAPVQATPTFNPPAGAVAFGTTVTITSAGADAIYYTTDGSNPATSATGATLAYTAPLTIDAAKTVKAIAVKAGYTNSAIGSAVYTQAATADLTGLALTGSPGNYTFASGTYTYNSVTVANAVASITVTPTGAGTIKVDGTTVTSGNASNLITLEAGVEKTITVVATETGKTAKTYTIKVTRAAPVQATPTFNPPAGAVAFGTTVTITSAGADAIYYTTDGSNPATSATGATLAYTAPLTIDAAKTVKAIAVKAGYTNSAIGSAVYTQAATADLTGLALTGSPGNYTFASGTYTYNSVTVANAVASITVTPTGAGTIKVDGTTVTSGNASNLITLEAGVEKTITVVATETGKTAKTYTIKVTRAALTVGDSYAGGIVAYIFQNGDPGYVTGEQHGLIAAAADQSAGVAWSPNYSNTWVAIGETGIALYTGKDNTDRITEFYDNSIYSTFTYAAGIARDYESGGYDDWFLPSLSEMLKLCDNRNAIGGFVAEDYWSSSEHSREYAYYIGNYSSPWWAEEYKNRLKRVRAVRYF